MNILITGGCGFIGLNLVDFLQKNSADRIVVLDNLLLGKQEDLGAFDVEFVEGDIRDQTLVPKLMQGMDAVIHLAADTRVIPSIENPDFNFDVNVRGTYNLLTNARNAGVEHFVFASTGGAIIGDTEPPVHEQMVPRPISPYGASKLFGEGYCSAFAGSYGMKTASLRFSNVYGPRSYHKGSVVALLFKQILKGEKITVYGDGEQTRDFVYVDDLCAAIRQALFVMRGGGAYQLGTGEETSVNHLIRLMRQIVGSEYAIDVEYVPARAGEVLRNYGDISLARRELGYDPKMSLTEGLKITWKWFVDNKSAFVA